jgi:REP element-mobilizing transposase RayT
MSEEREWRSRGYLPHIDGEELTQFIGWRTADSIPAAVLESWRKDLANSTETERWLELARRTERYCDEGHGECLLREPRAGRAVQECFFYDHGSKYRLHAWVVMPNHVHVVLTPLPGIKLDVIMRRVKTASANAVNRIFGRRGQFWQEEYFDRFIRGPEHFDGTVRYTEWNPVKAKLCTDPKKWAWSSCNPDARARLEFLERKREEGG